MIRLLLADQRKLDLGCPGETACQAFQTMGGLTVCQGCPKKVRLDQVPLEGGRPDPGGLQRLRHLVRLESMINVGCKFSPNDLSPREWDELIVLATERQWVDEQIRKLQDRQSSAGHAIEHSLDEGRRELQLPPPGGTLFPSDKPFR